jgi:chorismate dehydratase
MSAIRVGVVEYLNARPLVYGLDARPDLFRLQYDVPARCAALLHEGAVDLALLPAIEYLRGPDYRVVPGIAVASIGPVASVALFTTRPATAIRSIAIDASSRTAVALLRVLCAQWFDIEPKFITMQPDLQSMLKRCDAALLIGDIALFTEYEMMVDLDKIDLGEEWTAMTGLPFVWAFWAGRGDMVEPEHVRALRTARDAGAAAVDEVVAAHTSGDTEQAELATEYLRKNVHFALTEDGRSGVKRFYAAAADVGIVPQAAALRFFDA